MTTAYKYTPDGIRSSVTEAGVTTQYVIDSQSPSRYAQVVEERASGLLVVSYVYDTGLDPISMNRDTNASPTSLEAVLYLADGHSGVRQAVAAAGGAVLAAYRFDAFGNKVATAGTLVNPIGYRGERFDATLGQYYLRARFYDPRSGRFTGIDPFGGNYTDPLQGMRYGYAGANPVGNIDPSGQFLGGFGGMVGSFAARVSSFAFSAGVLLSKVSVIAFRVAIYSALLGVYFHATGNSKVGDLFFYIAGGALIVGGGAAVLAEVAFTVATLSGAIAYLSQRNPPISPVWDKGNQARGLELEKPRASANGRTELPPGFHGIDSIDRPRACYALEKPALPSNKPRNASQCQPASVSVSRS